MADTARDQVARMLALVPWLHRARADADRSGGEVRVEDAARALGVSAAQVDRDLRVLFMCGLPGGYPDDLIDVDIDALEEGVIRVSNADYLARPVRFAPAEATALVVALRALADDADPRTREVVDRTLAKIASATHDSAAEQVHVLPTRGPATIAVSETMAVVRRAIDSGRQLRLTYYSPHRDEQSDRVVDPQRVWLEEQTGYLDAWCHRARAQRIFRLDRILDIEILASEIVPHESEQTEPGPGRPRFDQSVRVRVQLEPPASWVAEYYPVAAHRDLGGGRSEIEVDVAHDAWLHQLLLRAAPDATVIAPAEFADAFLGLAHQALKLHTHQA